MTLKRDAKVSLAISVQPMDEGVTEEGVPPVALANSAMNARRAELVTSDRSNTVGEGGIRDAESAL